MNVCRYSSVLLICLLTVAMASPSWAQDDYIRLQVVELPGHFLHVESGEPEFGIAEPGWLSARWELRRVGAEKEIYALRNLWTGRYLSMKGPKMTTVAEPKIDPRTGEGADLWTIQRDRNDLSIVTLWHSGTKNRLPLPTHGKTLRLEGKVPEIVVPEFPKIDQEDYIRIQLTAEPVRYLHVEKDQPEFGAVKPGWISARWELKPASRDGNLVAIQSLWTGKYLTLADGKLTTIAEVRADPRTGQGPDFWRVERSANDPTIVSLINSGTGRPLPLPIKSDLRLEPPVAKVVTVKIDYYRLRSATTPAAAVHNENGPPAAGKVLPGWFSAQWEMADRDAGDGRYVTFKNRWTEKYLLVKNGTLTLDDAAVDPRTGQGPHLWRVIGQTSNPSNLILQHTGSGLFLQLGKPAGDGWDLNLTKNAGKSAWTFEPVK